MMPAGRRAAEGCFVWPVGYSAIILGVLTHAVTYPARADGYLSQRLLYVDSCWLAPLADDELDDGVPVDLEAVCKVIR
jgi:hypothetical protein